METKQKFIQFNNASDNNRFVLVNPTSIALIEQIDNYTIRITMKEIKDGQNISFTGNYDLATVLLKLDS